MALPMLHSVKSFIPALNKSLHKGQCGRICVIGGSVEYTGAPYFASMSALRTGADYIIVVASPFAAPAIKSYSPELIVHPQLCPEGLPAIKKCLSTCQAAVIGPGVGRREETLDLVKNIIGYILTDCSMPLVVDADAVLAVSKYAAGLVKGNDCRRMILTPNAVEYNHLVKDVLEEESLRTQNCAEPSREDVEQIRRLSKACGNACLLRKQQLDLICQGESWVQTEEAGSPRRCAGQGDLLAGSIATFASWACKATASSDERPSMLPACLAASSLIRRAASITFAYRGRSMVTTDILENIGTAFQQLFE